MSMYKLGKASPHESADSDFAAYVSILGVFVAGLAVLCLFFGYACDASARSAYPPHIPTCTTAQHQAGTCSGVQNKMGETIIITDPSFASNNPCSLISEQAPGGGNAGSVRIWCERGEEDWFQTVTSTRAGSVPPPSNLPDGIAGSQKRINFKATGTTNSTTVLFASFFSTLSNPASASTFQFILTHGVAGQRTAPGGPLVAITVPVRETFRQDGGFLSVCARTPANDIVSPQAFTIDVINIADVVQDTCTLGGVAGSLEARECCMQDEYLDDPIFFVATDTFDVRVTPVSTPTSGLLFEMTGSWLQQRKIVMIGASTVAGTVAFEPGVASKFDSENAWAFELARTHYDQFRIVNHAHPGSNSQDWDRGDVTENCRFTDAVAQSISGEDGPGGFGFPFSDPAAFVFLNLIINDTQTFRTCSGGSPIAGDWTTDQLTKAEFKTVTESIVAEVQMLAPRARIILMTDYSAAENCPSLDGTERCQYGVGAPQALFDFNAAYHEIADASLTDGVTATDDPSDIMEIPSVFFPNYSEPLDIGVTSPDRIHVGVNGHEVLHSIAARALELASFLEPLFVD